MREKNKEIKEITDIDLDTGTNLVTENYQLEILGLKDLVDLRKFSRSFLRVDKLLKSIFIGKEDKIDKKSAFNKEFGVAQNEVLEGSKLAEILGIEYGGVLNNNNQKVAGKGYYDTANKKIYKCTGNTSINYADAGYFIEVSNNDLLGKLQNLSDMHNYKVKKAKFTGGSQIISSFWNLFGVDRASVYSYKIGVMSAVSGSYFFAPERINSVFGGTDDASTVIVSSDSGGWATTTFATIINASFSHDNTQLIIRNITSGNLVLLYTLK